MKWGVCSCVRETQRDMELGQEGNNELPKFRAEEAAYVGTQMWLEFSEWGTEAGEMRLQR